MAIVSLLAPDGTNPKASMLGAVDAGERGAKNTMVIKIGHADIPTAANTYVLGQLPVGAAVVNCWFIVTAAFTDGIDFGIGNASGVSGTDGDVDKLNDDNILNNHTVGIHPMFAHASNNVGSNHLCTTDSHVVASAVADLSAGAGTLVVEYIKTL
jgi:hypothetical protein